MLEVRPYLVFVILAAVAGAGSTTFLLRRVGISTARLLVSQCVLVLIAFVGARAFSIWEKGHSWDALNAVLGAGGFRYAGGVVGFLIALPWVARYLRLAPGALADAVALPIAIAMVIVRAGCTLEGCCHGGLTGLPWGVSWPSGSAVWNEQRWMGLVSSESAYSLAVHPLPLYFGLWSFVVVVLIAWLRRLPLQSGHLFLIFLVVHETGKTLLEGLRFPSESHLQGASASLAAVAAAILLSSVSVRIVAQALRSRSVDGC